ncbi:MAG: MerR family DNA-binding protein, partial [Gammaproteobacteria bacterium]
AAGGVGIQTVRFYQRSGILSIPHSGKTGYREYDDSLLQQLRFIRKAQLAGFTLKEIKELITLDPKKDHSRIQEMTQTRLNELKIEIAELQEVYGTLHQLLKHCEHDSHEITCPIIETLGKM